jgi:hypothetical protein
MLSRDRRGLEGLPLKLLIISLLMSIAFPLVIDSLEQYEETVSMASVRSQACDIKAAATTAYLAGPGNVRTVRVELAQGGGIVQIELGGICQDPASMKLSCVVGHQATEVVMDSPPLNIVTKGGARICIESPGATIALECVEIDDRIAVLAMVL